ncbi:unnamed protein product [Trichogramma brassicae]|uniref:Uncharacterized protein n=1 Tax=Trichogramma brassicae TaxID=86971 RepID=A0A6H5IVK3_9HYME|nr:unnamed protein product [Trichogramma brassicae]
MATASKSRCFLLCNLLSRVGANLALARRRLRLRRDFGPRHNIQKFSTVYRHAASWTLKLTR